MIKFFFMAVMTANLENRPVVQFNTISALDQRNITAADLTKIQQAAGQMAMKEGVVFDDLLIQNIFFLAECTEAEFTAGTQLSERAEAELAHVELEPSNDAVDAAETLSQDALVDAAQEAEALEAPIDVNEHVDVTGTQRLQAEPVEDVTVDEAVTEDVPPTAA